MCYVAIKGDSIDTKCYQGIEQDIWISPDYRYMVLRKKGENENLLAWLKVKVVGYTNMVFSGYKCYKNQNEVILSE